MEQEINPSIISKYVNGLYQLSVCTGKIDMLLSYCENNYSQDNFLLSSIESLLNDVLKANGNDKDYNRIKIGSHNINTEHKVETKNEYISNTNDYEEPLNIKNVQTLGEKISHPLKRIVENKIKNKKRNIFYILNNSSNLSRLFSNFEDKEIKHMGFMIKPNETIFKFKNGRTYIFSDIPENIIETIITCDKNNASPGRYFNSEIRGQYEYREIFTSCELVG